MMQKQLDAILRSETTTNDSKYLAERMLNILSELDESLKTRNP